MLHIFWLLILCLLCFFPPHFSNLNGSILRPPFLYTHFLGDFIQTHASNTNHMPKISKRASSSWNISLKSSLLYPVAYLIAPINMSTKKALAFFPQTCILSKDNFGLNLGRLVCQQANAIDRISRVHLKTELGILLCDHHPGPNHYQFFPLFSLSILYCFLSRTITVAHSIEARVVILKLNLLIYLLWSDSLAAFYIIQSKSQSL